MLKRAVCLLFFLFAVFTEGFGTEFSLKLTGGISFLNPADTNQTLQDWTAWYRRESERRRQWVFLEGEAPSLKKGFDFGGELLLSFSPHIAISLGTGYCYGNIEPEKTELTIQKSEMVHQHIHPVKFSTIPLIISGYYMFDVIKNIKFFVRNGVGIAFAKLIERDGSKKTTAASFSYSLVQNTSAQSLVLSGGIGIMYHTETGLSFFAEGSLRKMKINHFQGDNDAGEKGTLYFFEEYDPNLDLWQAKSLILSQNPEGENIRNAREAVLNLSGWILKTGIIIKF